MTTTPSIPLGFAPWQAPAHHPLFTCAPSLGEDAASHLLQRWHQRRADQPAWVDNHPSKAILAALMTRKEMRRHTLDTSAELHHLVHLVQERHEPALWAHVSGNSITLSRNVPVMELGDCGFVIMGDNGAIIAFRTGTSTNRVLDLAPCRFLPKPDHPSMRGWMGAVESRHRDTNHTFAWPPRRLSSLWRPDTIHQALHRLMPMVNAAFANPGFGTLARPDATKLAPWMAMPKHVHRTDPALKDAFDAFLFWADAMVERDGVHLVSLHGRTIRPDGTAGPLGVRVHGNTDGLPDLFHHPLLDRAMEAFVRLHRVPTHAQIATPGQNSLLMSRALPYQHTASQHQRLARAAALRSFSDQEGLVLPHFDHLYSVRDPS